MAVPVAGQLIRASDAITYADAKPRCHVFDSVGNIVVDAGADKLILFDSELYDSTGTMHGASTSRLVAPIAGIYRLSVLVTMPTATYTVSNMNIALNAAGVFGAGTSLQNTAWSQAGGASTQPSPKSEVVRALAANDYLEVFVRQTSGANRTNIVGAYATRAYMEYVASS